MPVCKVLPLQGGCNFRDLGGYRTADGRQVRHGQLYRSGVLAYLTDDDLAQLARLGIVAICDLRREKERHSEPTRWHDPGVRVLAWDDDRDADMVGRLGHVRSVAEARAGMLELYRNMPVWLAPRLRGLFRYLTRDDPAPDTLAAGALPLVFHCAAGKDRTGLAAALLLRVLGVPHEDVLADYVATNEAVDLERFIGGNRRSNLGLANIEHPIFTVPEEARRVMFRAEPEYLEAAFETIDRRPGGMERYLVEDLGLDDQRREVLAARLLA